MEYHRAGARSQMFVSEVEMADLICGSEFLHVEFGHEDDVGELICALSDGLTVGAVRSAQSVAL